MESIMDIIENIYTAFVLPTSDGKFCEIGISLEEDDVGYSGISLFPEGFMREEKFEAGTEEGAEEAGEQLKSAELQEQEARKYLEQYGLSQENWERDSGGTGLMEWVSYREVPLTHPSFNDFYPIDQVVMKVKCREVLEKLRKSSLREKEMTAV